MEEILDDLTEPDLPPSRKGVDKIIWIYATVTTFLFLIYHLFLVDIFPTYLLEVSSYQIPFESFYILLTIIIVINLLIRQINLKAPHFDEIVYVIWGASSIFYGCFFYKIIIELIGHQSISILEIWFNLKISMALSLVGGVISYIVIHRIRQKNMIIPYIVLIGFAIAINFLLKIIL